MRKRLIASVFIVFLLCASVFAGHTQPGGGWCECGSAGCICEPGEGPGITLSSIKPDESKQETPFDLGSETLLVFAVLLLVLRYKA